MTFEDLESWQKARMLVNAAYMLTRKDPLNRDFALCSQLQRAAVSVMTNIAEGFERVHLPEKLQFYNVARASAGEARSLTYVVSDNFPQCAAESGLLRVETTVVGKLVSGLISSTARRRSGLIKILTTLLGLIS